VTSQAEKSNRRHRPIGIGVQGLADAYLSLRYPFESDEAQRLNRDIFETIYYSALKSSCELARDHGAYETYEGSPVSRGVSVIVVFFVFTFEPGALCILKRYYVFLSAVCHLLIPNSRGAVSPYLVDGFH